MSILIKGMKMPKPGRYEAVIIVLDKSTAEIAISPAEDDIGYWKEYPLVPVPPHGRLIDADAVLRRYDYELSRTYTDDFAKGFQLGVKAAVGNGTAVVIEEEEGET